ncbi:hypothetical protein A0H81_13866 [Grifola frondosa]|uniref:Protein kinase domain-containing protein n=1 Tax=Grifola frondosa TaxID=5627 RepID=A0A1C7LQM1_GRIFR|nr:hypothetical protein A0H81_13866 [Grifola frondosa]
MHPTFCEDSIILDYYHVIDATRQADNYLVAIKVVPKDTDEIRMARALTIPALLQLPRNHCVPILDVLPDPLNENMSLLTLEGLRFIHDQRVAHRDCAAANIMMDARSLFPGGHTTYKNRLHPRCHLSTHFPKDASTYVVGKMGRDKEVPELSSDVPYDAFKVDVFALGNLYDKEFLQKHHGLDFLQPLVDAMKDIQPARRPSAEHALTIFNALCSQLNSTLLRWRLRSRTESTPERVILNLCKQYSSIGSPLDTTTSVSVILS